MANLHMSAHDEQLLRIQQLYIDFMGVYAMFNTLISDKDLDVQRRQAIVDGLYQRMDDCLESVEILKQEQKALPRELKITN